MTLHFGDDTTSSVMWLLNSQHTVFAWVRCHYWSLVPVDSHPTVWTECPNVTNDKKTDEKIPR